jgi:hypothetical protein
MSQNTHIRAGRARGVATLVLIGLSSLALGVVGFGQTPPPTTKAGKTFIDYFKPIPIRGTLRSDVWGAPVVLPRDQKNGLEDEAIKEWCYWDGQILKGSDGKYHIYASRWAQANGHNGWRNSVAVHAVSDNPIGPYVDKGMMWPDDMGGKGHNVTALMLADGRYAVIVSEIRPGAVFASKSPDGPWENLGPITLQDQPNWRASNLSVMLRPDGDYMIVNRAGQILISKTGVLGPYTIMNPQNLPNASVYPQVPGLPLRNLEDPVVWYSGGLYHIVVNGWADRKAWHITSKDGVTNWTFRGLAYDPKRDVVKYTNGVVNHWDKMERPGVFVENGHVTAFTLAVLDVEKNAELGNDQHGSKVIVIPFDGAALDKDLKGGDVPQAPPAPMSAAYDALHPGEPPTVPAPPAGRGGGRPGGPGPGGPPAAPPAR